VPAPKIEVTEIPLGEELGTGYGLTVNGRFYTSHANREDAQGDLNRFFSQKPNILVMADLIENAEEIHVMRQLCVSFDQSA
jgi:hypothetical protein